MNCKQLCTRDNASHFGDKDLTMFSCRTDNNLIWHVLNNIGTPKHLGIPVNTYSKALAASLRLSLWTRESGLQVIRSIVL
ncbi:hypothetical protein EJ110_NYTH31518 [Nymphaea thermarum]|nr:hypothetical protein EJ110_NYTH31518 [Nymphaea thermarum]